MPRDAMRHRMAGACPFLALSANRQGGRWAGMNGGAGDISISSSWEHNNCDMTRVVYKVYTFSARGCKQSMQFSLFYNASGILIQMPVVATASPRIQYDYFFIILWKTGYTLQERMIAAVAGEWWKIVSDVNSVAITSSDNGQLGAGKISALAIADCVDGVHDLGYGTGTGTLIAGSGWSGVNTTLRNWAGAAGASALPYFGDDAGSTGNNDFETAGSPTGEDPTLGCGSGGNYFYMNFKACGSDMNYSWAAACGSISGGNWASDARSLGYDSPSNQNGNNTSRTAVYNSFRVVARP